MTPPKRLAKCLSTTGGKHLVIRNPLTLWYISRISGAQPPNFMVLGNTLCAGTSSPCE